MDTKKVPSNRTPFSTNSVYENKKKLVSYHRSVCKEKPTLKQNRSMMIHEKKIDDVKSIKSSKYSNKHQKSVNDYNPNKAIKFGNFSQKLHAASNTPRESNKSSVHQNILNEKDISFGMNKHHIMSMHELSTSKYMNDINDYAIKAKRTFEDDTSEPTQENILSGMKNENDALYYSDESQSDKRSAPNGDSKVVYSQIKIRL
jgi:hypothetical protein